MRGGAHGVPGAALTEKEVLMSRTLKRGMGTGLALAAVGLALLPGAASAAEPQTGSAVPVVCDVDDVCVFSQNDGERLVFEEPTGQMIDLFRYFPGPGPSGSWANGVYRLINRTRVPVQLQDVDNHPPTIFGEVPPGQNVVVPELALNEADRLLIIG